MDEAAAEYMALVDALVSASDELSPLGAGIVAASALGVACDSRSFARILGVAHALVLREIVTLAADGGTIRIDRRDPRTQRTYYELTPIGRRLVEDARV